MMKTAVLWNRLRGQVSRTDFYNFLSVYENREPPLIVRPTRGLIVLVKKPGFWERRAERKQLERWESRLVVLQTLRPYFRLRIEADPYHSRMWEFMLEEINEEFDMLKKLIMSKSEQKG